MRVLSLILLLAACSPSAPPAQPPASEPEPATARAGAPASQPTAKTQADTVTIGSSWVRAVPPGAGTTAWFGVLTNEAPSQATVTGASSPAAGSVELHTHVEQDGMMKMRQVDRLDIPGADHLHLQPGGDHIMLIGLQEDLAEGASVPLTLTFADGSTKAVTTTVTKGPPGSGPGHDHADGAHSHGSHDGDHAHEHSHEGGTTHAHPHKHADGDKSDHSHDHDKGHGHDHDKGHSHDHDQGADPH